MSEPSNPTSASASSPDILAGTAERDAAEARLRRATGDGALDLEEFAQRMELLLRARTRGEVERVVADLPVPAAGPPASRRPERRWIVAVMGGEETTGRWRPAPKTTALAIMGGVEVDLREAELDDVVLDAVAVMGGIEVIVPEGVAVEVRGFSLMGGREVRVRQPESPDAPMVVINAYAVMGSVEIRNAKPRKGRDRPADSTPAVRRHATHPVPHRPRWVGKAIVAAAIGLFTLPLWTGGAISVFGSREYQVSQQALADDGYAAVNATTMFGSVEIIVPDDVAVESTGLVLFGSTNCDACAEPSASDDVVRVRGFGAFGSVNIIRESEARESD